MPDDQRPTVQQFIEQLMAASEQVGGLQRPVELVICLGDVQQVIDRVEVTWQHEFDQAGKIVIPSREIAVLILGHWHVDQSPGAIRRAVTEDVDEELREMTEGDDGG